MDNELKIVRTYCRKVFGHWWVLTIEGVLVLLDLGERLFGTWLLPPLWVKVTIGVGVLVVAQFLAYRKLWTKVTQLNTAESERGKKVADRIADRTKFGRLMEEGQNLYREIANVGGQDFEAWDALLTGWQESIRVSLAEIGFPADFQEFMRAIDEAEPLGGIINRGWKQENRRRKLQKQQQKLEEIVQRRLP